MLCFDLSIESPYKLLFDVMKYYRVESRKVLRDAAWAFISDSNLTQLCLLFPSRTIACAALYASAKSAEVAFPDEKGVPWWTVQRVQLRDIRRACNYMAAWYKKSHLKPNMGEGVFIGLRTPEDGDEETAKTRLKVEHQGPVSPARSAVSMDRTGSQQSLKRDRDKFEGERGEIRREEAMRLEREEEDNREANGQPRPFSRRPEAARAAENGAPSAPGWAAGRGEPAAKRAKLEEGNAGSTNIPIRRVENGNGALKAEEAEASEEGELEE